jgi:hypothetical protein
MFTVTTYRDPALIAAELSGRSSADELQHLTRDIDYRLRAAGDPPPSLLLDVQSFEEAGSHLSELLESYVRRTLDAQIRVGRVVASEIVAHQLDRVAAEAGLQDRIRHFWTPEPALAWLREPGR